MLSNSIALIAVAALFGVEAYKAKERLPRVVLTILAVVFALWSLLVEQVAEASPRVGAFVTSVFAEPSSWFVLFMAVFFVIRPFWQPKAHPASPVTLDQLAANGVLAEVQHRLGKIEALPELDHTSAQYDDTGLRHDLERAEARIGAEVERIEALTKKLDARVGLSFYALRTREALEQISADIETDAEILYARLADGETYDIEAWGKWENVHYHWLGLIRAWIEHGKWYYGDLTTAVLDVPDHKYSGENSVSDNQLPNAEAVRVFKKFRIIHAQWQAVKDKVRENLYYVAYHGMSDVEVRHGEQAR
jgi:hypothetical protein